MREVVAFTDGSCNNRKGHPLSRVGGIGVVLRSGSNEMELSHGPFYPTSSARMEIMAVILALESVKVGNKVKIYSDNQYVVNTVKERWWEKWKYEEILNSKKNTDLLARMFNRIYQLGGYDFVSLHWVKGHVGIEDNERADRLADAGRKKQTPQIEG